MYVLGMPLAFFWGGAKYDVFGSLWETRGCPCMQIPYLCLESLMHSFMGKRKCRNLFIEFEFGYTQLKYKVVGGKGNILLGIFHLTNAFKAITEKVLKHIKEDQRDVRKGDWNNKEVRLSVLTQFPVVFCAVDGFV